MGKSSVTFAKKITIYLSFPSTFRGSHSSIRHFFNQRSFLRPPTECFNKTEINLSPKQHLANNFAHTKTNIIETKTSKRPCLTLDSGNNLRMKKFKGSQVKYIGTTQNQEVRYKNAYLEAYTLHH